VPNNQDIGPQPEQGFQRVRYDLSHWSMKVGSIGGLQTLSCIPIVAGDSMEIDLSTVVRLSPLRRNLYIDAVVELFAFYIPYRHIYSDWATFLKAGIDESTTLGTVSPALDARIQCVGMAVPRNEAIPTWLTKGYMQIWNRYFRDPSDIAGTLAETYLEGLAVGNTNLAYGIPCAQLKRMWNSAPLTTTSTADYRLALSGGEVDLYEFANLQGRLRTEQSRDWYALRYQDILNHSWGTSVNIDADQRPELIMRTKQWLSGYDVDGTDDATLGTYAGKGQTVAKMTIPKKFFAEHGTLWFMMLVRIPPIHEDETHYLVNNPEPTYKMIAGDPDIIQRAGPIDLQNGDIFAGQSGASLGTIPYAQWYREQPHMMHDAYTDAAGHPFLNFTPSSRNTCVYLTHTMYDDMFMSLMLKHWNCQSFISVMADRYIPDAQASIFAGTK